MRLIRIYIIIYYYYERVVLYSSDFMCMFVTLFLQIHISPDN